MRLATMRPYDAHWTVWRFTSPTTGETVVVAHHSEPGDERMQHEYQRIVWQGWASSRAEAQEHAARCNANVAPV